MGRKIGEGWGDTPSGMSMSECCGCWESRLGEGGNQRSLPRLLLFFLLSVFCFLVCGCV